MEPGFLGVPDVDAAIFAGLALTAFCTAFIAGVTGTAGCSAAGYSSRCRR